MYEKHDSTRRAEEAAEQADTDELDAQFAESALERLCERDQYILVSGILERINEKLPYFMRVAA